MRKILLLWIMIVMSGGPIIGLQNPPDSSIELTKFEAQTVFYTVIRGHYAEMGKQIRSLYALAAEKGIHPAGPLQVVYLNNPRHVDSPHWLCEIRIPVSKETLTQAGTFGAMTDVKQLPAMTAAAVSRENIMADPTALYERLYDWISAEKLMPIGDPVEIFTGDHHNMGQMKSRILIPVEQP